MQVLDCLSVRINLLHDVVEALADDRVEPFRPGHFEFIRACYYLADPAGPIRVSDRRIWYLAHALEPDAIGWVVRGPHIPAVDVDRARLAIGPSRRIGPAQPDVIAAALWSLVHGYITLELAEHFAEFDDPVRQVPLPMGVTFKFRAGRHTRTRPGLPVSRSIGRIGCPFATRCAQIRRAIADGEVRPGERLPPARDLAAVLNVNSNTVLRALRRLRDEGLLEFRRGRRITVVGPAHRGAVLARARELVQFARGNGYGRDELIKIVEDIA